MDLKKIIEQTKAEMQQQMASDQKQIQECHDKVKRSEGAIMALYYLQQKIDAVEKEEKKAKKKGAKK